MGKGERQRERSECCDVNPSSSTRVSKTSYWPWAAVYAIFFIKPSPVIDANMMICVYKTFLRIDFNFSRIWWFANSSNGLTSVFDIKKSKALFLLCSGLNWFFVKTVKTPRLLGKNDFIFYIVMWQLFANHHISEKLKSMRKKVL